MAKAKCRICGESLDTTTAYKVISYDASGKEKRAYYCSQEEYEEEENRKKKAADDKDRVYRLICDIICRKEIINTVLWKEWKLWNKVATDELIGQYLEENKIYLTSVIARLDDVEFNRIRYLSAIIKNKLGDFKPKAKETPKPKVQVEETVYEPQSENNAPMKSNKRRSLADLEDEF